MFSIHCRRPTFQQVWLVPTCYHWTWLQHSREHVMWQCICKTHTCVQPICKHTAFGNKQQVTHHHVVWDPVHNSKGWSRPTQNTTHVRSDSPSCSYMQEHTCWISLITGFWNGSPTYDYVCLTGLTTVQCHDKCRSSCSARLLTHRTLSVVVEGTTAWQVHFLAAKRR